MTILNLADESTGGMNLSTTYDLAGGDKDFIIEISTGSIALDIEALSLTGTLDATVKLYESQTTNFTSNDQLGSTFTLNTATYSNGWKEDIFNSRYMKVEITVNNCTGGTINLPLTLK
jgi:hypothetical protein